MSSDVAVIEVHAVLVLVSIKYETIRVGLSSLRINKRDVLLGTILRYLVAFYKVITFGSEGGTIHVDTCSLRIYGLLFLRGRHIAIIDSTLEPGPVRGECFFFENLLIHLVNRLKNCEKC